MIPPSAPAATPPGRLLERAGIAWLVLDDPEAKVNTLSSRLIGWFETWLAEVERNRPRGLVILSGKSTGFVAGADLDELSRLEDASSLASLLSAGHALTRRLERLELPTVAAIHGACLGGGLELALACRFRVASSAAATQLGLPEVQLGLIPGLGGTQRLPRKIGVPQALGLILTGRRLSARQAWKLGLVDEVVAREDLGLAAERFIRARARRARPLRVAAANLLARLPGASAAIYGPARRKVLAETGGHYPAPLAALEVVEKGLAKPLDAALELETERFAQLALSPTAKNLIGLFFLKRTVEAEASSLARGAGPVSRLGVLGGGFMGIGIAQLAAHRGLSVVVKDRDQPSLERGLKQAAELFQPLVRRGRLTVPELRTAMTRLVPTLSARDFAGVDLVVEAVFEDLEVKHQVLRETEAALHPRAVFASNTSTLPIGRIAEASARPERVLGMHFFSPVAKMPLLEVIRHPGSDPEAVSRAVAAGEKLGKTVIVVEDGPGFFTTRVLAPLLNEAAWSLVEGASIEEIDRALKAWGWPVGPLTLLDEVGLDVGRHVQEVLRAAFGERMSPPEALARLLADGRSGRKSGRGFYRYDGGQKRVDESVYRLLDWQSRPQPAEDIADRCWLAMLNEAARAQAEGILTDPKAIDLAVIFGFGFPPFRGGILREADRRGLGWVVDRLDRLAERYGERLRPAPVLREMATPSKRFHQAG